MKEPTVFDDDENEIPLPWKWEICRRCEGHGHHSNPAIDGHGITYEEMYEAYGPDYEEEFLEPYLSGHYDIPCENGCEDGKIKAPDFDRMPIELIRRYNRQEQELAEMRAMERAEREMGA